MPCRVGMTTRPVRRKKEWESIYPTLSNWKILHMVWTKRQAQNLETLEAMSRNCESSEGGAGPERAKWYVYYFQYTED